MHNGYFLPFCAYSQPDLLIWSEVLPMSLHKLSNDSQGDVENTSGLILPEDFDGEAYLLSHPDVLEAGIDPAEHFLTTGLKEGRSHKAWSSVPQEHSIALPLGYTPAAYTGIVGVFCHIFYPDLASEIFVYLLNIPNSADLFLTTDTEEKRNIVAQVFQDWWKGVVSIKVTPNRGRDIAPKLLAFPEAYERYELILHIHTKVSPHHGKVRNWRRMLFECLLGSPEIVAGTLECFQQDLKLGIVGPQHVDFIREWINWGDNKEKSQELARRIGFSIDHIEAIDFISGSMFWARSAALRPLLRAGLTIGDFPDESGQIDATIAHAVERLYLLVCEYAGYNWIKVATPRSYFGGNIIHTVHSPMELREVMARNFFSLTASTQP
ncbi:hypothetical protein HGP16_21475 [Rhizobium sp. P40RR-XXII]|uniref:rhamnan synthesis F family protein n=1 Tax=Rhizobium sp. P40RR-XXII TaxID=2726739 RepID=UPI001456FCA9|nr:rhamnan synthesis F family protein [Rhizobium sp. P40RR-XXII]NLS19108.1 hypothetical protein [Rhizobium sp. P40RR-XXII]